MSKNRKSDHFFEIFKIHFVPGHPGTEEFVPGHLLLPLSRTKGHQDNGTSCPSLSRDVLSVGNPSIYAYSMHAYGMFVCPRCVCLEPQNLFRTRLHYEMLTVVWAQIVKKDVQDQKICWNRLCMYIDFQ